MKAISTPPEASISHQGVCPPCKAAAALWPGWSPLIVLPIAVCAFGGKFPAWGFMWLLAFALYAGCKWLTWWQARMGGFETGGWRGAGYLFAWPGMDAPAFFKRDPEDSKPPLGEWRAAILKTCLGAMVVWGVTRHVPAEQALVAGWVGMIGLILVLHFGSFHLLSLFWRRAGIDAQPIMRAPILSSSLSEFWSMRWNLAFRQLCRDYVFRPVLDRMGMSAALLVVFLVSGLIHELVISLPANGGYGLPTAYFMVQGLGILFEHSRVGRWSGIQQGMRGRFYTILVAAAPALWLFHSPFIHNVMTPFLKIIGAWKGDVL